MLHFAKYNIIFIALRKIILHEATPSAISFSECNKNDFVQKNVVLILLYAYCVYF